MRAFRRAVYLLGSMERQEELAAVLGVLRSGWDTESSGRTVQVWARCYKIGGGVAGS
jgi:hypothetical protein